MWPFPSVKESPRLREHATCLHGLIHVALYRCPDCGVLQITTNRPQAETIAMLGDALRGMRLENERARSALDETDEDRSE